MLKFDLKGIKGKGKRRKGIEATRQRVKPETRNLKLANREA